MTDEQPDLCDWCGTPIEQPPTGRRRRYCRRTCRELAYRERRTRRRIDDAVAAVLSVDRTETTPPVS